MCSRKKEDVKIGKILFVKRSCECLALLEASNVWSLYWLGNINLFLTVKILLKPCLNKMTKWFGDKSIERKVNKIALSRQTITQHIEELSYDVTEQQKDRVHACSFFSLALDVSADICDVVQLSIFATGTDDNFNIFEEIIDLESLRAQNRESDMIEEVRK